jgi:hypothetical protein
MPYRRPIHDEVTSFTASVSEDCHPSVAMTHKQELERYARISMACESLESFVGFRPRDDDDLFGMLSERRMKIADTLARANLSAYLKELPPGLYLSVPYFHKCSDIQPLSLINLSEKTITYIGRKLYAFASNDNGIDEYHASGNAFASRIAAASEIKPGGALTIDDYSMQVDGDFVGNRIIILLIENVRTEWFTVISKHGGFLWDGDNHGLHRLELVNTLESQTLRE